MRDVPAIWPLLVAMLSVSVLINVFTPDQCEPASKGNSRAVESQLLLPYYLTPEKIRAPLEVLPSMTTEEAHGQ